MALLRVYHTLRVYSNKLDKKLEIIGVYVTLTVYERQEREGILSRWYLCHPTWYRSLEYVYGLSPFSGMFYGI
jgi:hypothetical protein